MNFRQYQTAAYRTANQALSERDELTCAAMGLAGEAGEFVDRVKKIVFQGHPLDDAERQKLREECGDVMWYAALACTALQASMEDVCVENVAKLERRYPEKFSSKRSMRR